MERNTSTSEFTSETTKSMINFDTTIIPINFETPAGFITTFVIHCAVIFCVFILLISLVFRLYRTLDQFRKLINFYTIACILYPIASTIFFVANRKWSFITQARMITMSTFILNLLLFSCIILLSRIPKKDKIGIIVRMGFIIFCFVSSIIFSSIEKGIEVPYISFFVFIFAKLIILARIRSEANKFTGFSIEEDAQSNTIQLQLGVSDQPPAYNTAQRNATLYPPSDIFQAKSSDQPPTYDSIIKSPTEV